MDRNSPPINLTCPTNAQKSLKTSEINQKTAQQFQDLPPRNFASNQLPPPVKHTQKSRFYSQIKQTTSGNLTLATATPTINSFSPVFTSKNQNSLVNSVTEVNSAGSPAAPASQTLYDVVSDANVRDDQVSARGGIGNAPERISHSTQSLADSTFSARSDYTQDNYCPASLNPLLHTPKTPSSVQLEVPDINDTLLIEIPKLSNMGGLASPPKLPTDTFPAKNRPCLAHNPFFQDFTPLQTVISHSSALKPCLTNPKVSKSLKDLIISQKNELKTAQITAILKDSMQLKPKSQKKIISNRP